MRIVSVKPRWLATLMLLLAGQTVHAVDLSKTVDLSKIERTIAKEPIYQTKTPKYCLLVFGLEANARAWLVVDGDFLYVDRNCNGDLTEEGERVAIKKGNLPSITEPDGTRHQIGFRQTPAGFGLSSKSYGGQYVGSTYRKDLLFADRPQDAPIVHFGGPLTFEILEAPKRWVPGEEAKFIVLFGTPGLGKETFAHMIHSFPSRPTADIEFPGKKAGDPPIWVKVVLTKGEKDRFTGG
jgi:hypothetical protein